MFKNQELLNFFKLKKPPLKDGLNQTQNNSDNLNFGIL
jgi:hypothetical protein